jgi:D-lactate dehydrogenase
VFKLKLAFFDTKPHDRTSFNKPLMDAGIEVKYFDTHLNKDTVSLASGFDAVCVFVNDVIDEFVVERLCEFGIGVIVLRCAGFNNIDIKACEGKIKVFRVPAYSPYAVAEHAMALLLTINRRTHKAYARTRDFNFSLANLCGFDLYGKTVGIIGTGKIGKVFANICKGFGMNILAYDKFPSSDLDVKYVELDELFAKSDIISLHCPLTFDTYHMINAMAIKMMKPGAVIINTSRGGLIDTDALINGLLDRKVGAACLDVYEEEADVFFEDRSGHILDDDKLVRLIAMPNVLVTSHQAFLTNEALDNIAATTVGNLQKFMAGENDDYTEVKCS